VTEELCYWLVIAIACRHLEFIVLLRRLEVVNADQEQTVYGTQATQPGLVNTLIWSITTSNKGSGHPDYTYYQV
jgi:hypothetical protein